MKTVTYLITLALLISSAITQAQFQPCNSSTTKDLKDVYFMDYNTGIAVGDSGTIVRSTDGGLNWNVVLMNDTVSFTKVNFFDAVNGIAIGTDLYKTDDAGQTWSRIPHSNNQFYDLEILNSTTCIISGEPLALIKSNDTGLTFSTLVNQQTLNYEYGLISFVSEMIGYTCSLGGGLSSMTLKTTDGGFNWVQLQDTVSGNNPTVMEALNFVSETIGFKGGWYNTHLEKTTDGANFWQGCNYVDSLASLQLLDFHIEIGLPNAYYACGWYGEIFKSVNGGNDWFELNSGLSNTTSLYGIYFKDSNTGWAVGKYGTIIRTTNGGGSVGLEDAGTDLDLIMYPNPTNSELTIELGKVYKSVLVTIMDMTGKQVATQSFLNTDNINLLIEGAPGTYLLNIQTEKVNTVIHAIKR